MKIEDLNKHIGMYFGDVELQTCKDVSISRPRVQPTTNFATDVRVEFPRKLREMFPIGTRFRATVKVCQKHSGKKPKGPPYLKACDISVIAASVTDSGLMANVKSGSISGLSYEYVWKTKR